MSIYPKSIKYYASSQNQKRIVNIIAGLFVVTVIYALFLQNNTAKIALLLGSLGYPIVILLGFLEARPKSNFLEMNEDGIVITRLGIKRKPMYWSSIEYIGETGYLSMDGVGIKYNSSKNRNSWTMEFFRRKFGYDTVILNFYRPDGIGLSEDAKRYFDEWSKSHAQKASSQQDKESRSKWVLP